MPLHSGRDHYHDAVSSDEPRISPLASVSGDSVIGPGCVIHPFSVVGAGVELGREVEVFPGALIGKEPTGAGATAREPTFAKHIKIGDQSSIGPNSVVYYDVEIGANTLIGDSASIREQCRVGSRCIISRCVTLNYNCIVGDRTKVMDGTHLTGNMTVGDDVFISVNVTTVNDNAMGQAGYTEQVVGPQIADRAVVGAAAVLLPGVSIGESSTVGAGAVVTKDVAPGSKVMGVPARPVTE
jgi:acetyltransferase-like isoleucine patch superfamily enzyme